ncbi:MAG: response regulator [Chroococcidiopsidaceae cyanobacterium CP_BM_ER_R8_30]|nr:response regulator [Chroococcidiopsidaceae cyanobacterium CP_BM_ER_R8_30]
MDDIPDNIRLLSNILVERGYSVRKAISGQIAMTAVKSLPPDLILLDVNMPKIDGYAVCRMLKEDAQTSSIPVIFLSALDEVLDKIQAFQVGAVDYITKPFHFEEVLIRVETQLKIRNLQAQLQIRNSQLEEALSNLQIAQDQLSQKEKAVPNQLATSITYANTELSNFVGRDEMNYALQNIRDLLKLIKLYQQEYPNPTPSIQEAIGVINLNLLISNMSDEATTELNN